MTSTDRLAEACSERSAAVAAEIERLRARVAELEAIVTVGAGTMGTLQPDEPATITHGHPPSAPPHDEPQPPIGHAIKWPTRTGDDNE